MKGRQGVIRTLEIVDETSMTQELEAKILRGLCIAFPDDREFFSKERGWHGSWPEFSVVARGEDGGIQGHVAIVERRVTFGNKRVTVGGVQNVFVAPEMRKTGLSGELMRRAMTESLRREYDCGLLFCLPALEKVYSSMGWRNMGERAIVRREGGNILPLPDKNSAMYYPLKTDAPPDGALDLQGNDW